MAADSTTFRTAPTTPLAPGTAGLATGRRAALSPGTRILRQVQGIDAWVAARRERERALQGHRLTRDERMDVDREVQALRRTHDAIKGRCARALESDTGLLAPGLTAVIAHRHAWYVDRVALHLDSHGVSVLVCTDNGAEALGTVVAEQPDVVLVGDRLAMMAASTFLAESRRYAPSTLLAVQASDQVQAEALQAGADMVLLRHHSPGIVADALVALDLVAAGQPGRA